MTFEFTAVVHITFTLLLYQLVHANRSSDHWSKWSQHKSYGTSKIGTGAWAIYGFSQYPIVTSLHYISDLLLYTNTLPRFPSFKSLFFLKSIFHRSVMMAINKITVSQKHNIWNIWFQIFLDQIWTERTQPFGK